MRIVIRIQKIYLIFIKIFRFQLKEKKIEKYNKLICNIHDKENCVVDIKALDQAYNAIFGKTSENVGKHRDIKLVTKEKRRNQLALEPNYHKHATKI